MSNQSVYIIAEAGVNHNGDLRLAKKLVDAAVEAKADAVKFQTFRAENLIVQGAAKAEYQKITTGQQESQFDMLKRLELSLEGFRELKEYCDQKGIEFMSTPFDLPSIDYLVELGMKTMKIPSGQLNDYPYLRKVGQLAGDVILSTGMCTLEDIEQVVQLLIESGTPKSKISILHCNSAYPTPFEDVNLRAMNTIKERFQLEVGYSDHTPGIEVSLAAVALGARIIEKHFTLDKEMEGPDHCASLDVDELKALVSGIRHIEKALGSPNKDLSRSEKINLVAARKSLVAKKPIRRGEVFSEDNLAAKRPANGLSPMLWPQIIGQPASQDYSPDDMISEKF
ncbi:MAG: N-acetylneuraminate synthase [Bdellovibrionales bacterium]